MINVSGFNIAAVLFDLDNTLVDRDAAVRKLGLTFAGSILTGNPTLSRQDVIDTVMRIDAGGFVPDKRAQMLAIVGDLLMVGTDADELKSWWASTQTVSYWNRQP
jgi:FMN phosphatase YigB (HAD superfamily)